MPSLEQTTSADAFHLRAAEGWLELGNPFEALQELESINGVFRAHPLALEMRCRVLERAGQWHEALALAETLCKKFPKRLEAWLCQARSLHELGRTHQAYHLLVDIVELFPGNASIRYDIACYAAQRGLIEEAAEWLKISFDLDKDRAFRSQALRDARLAFVLKDYKKLLHC